MIRRRHIVRPGQKVIRWIEVKIRLKINGEKTYVVLPERTTDAKAACKAAKAKAKARWPQADVKVKGYRERSAVTKAGK